MGFIWYRYVDNHQYHHVLRAAPLLRMIDLLLLQFHTRERYAHIKIPLYS